ncbi:MAG: prolyl oligopeptidase family serine peptidase [Gemmatimonadota bacterium]
MRRQITRTLTALVLVGLLHLPALWVTPPVAAQTLRESLAEIDRTNEGRALELAEYSRWRTIRSPEISADGEWVAWVYNQVRQDDVLHVRHVESGREHVVERASSPLFSDDARWVAYRVSLPLSELEAAEEAGEARPRRAELLDLETGERVGWDGVQTFEFARGSSHLAVHKAPASDPADHEGADLILRDLRSGSDELIAAVSAFVFNRPGGFVAMTIDAPEREGNGLYLTELATGRRQILDSGRQHYERLTWSEDGGALAAVRGVDADTLAERDNALLTFRGIVAGSVPTRHLVSSSDPGIPAGHVISERGALEWNDDNGRLIFGIREQRRVPARDPDAWQKASDVDVFHWNDDRIQTVQRRQADADRNRTGRAMLHLDDRRVVYLADTTPRSTEATRDGRWLLAEDDRRYLSDWEERRSDWYRIDTTSGDRTAFLEEQGATLGLSPAGTHFLYWRDEQVWAYDIAADRHVDLTSGAPVSFVDREWDYIGQPPPYGVAGWTADGRHVVLEHRYDLWLVPLDGGEPRVLTGGVGDERGVRLRYVRLDPDERFIDLGGPVLLTAYGEWTKQSGFFELRDGRIRELVLEDRHYATPTKARDADRLLFTREHWTESPDLHVASADFSNLHRLTEANPQQDDYAWGDRILFEYTNADGVRLQGTLAVPDSWQPGQRLPMLVNFYEKNSQNLHRYQTPTYVHRPQFAAYVSRGYLVMQPDIHFRGGSSHSDMLECVEAAVRKVIELGYADPERIGLHGHSYSGGGASYIATRSDLFAAIVAGAAPINLVSEFNQLFRGSGQNNHRYDIHGQGRYGSNPYDDFDLYWNQSPISGVTEMNTPLLYMHGDNDQTVEYLQGMELYNSLRFNQKPVIFLSYPGEGHGLSELENQLDFQLRMQQFFGHYLRGEPAPRWITEGEPFLEKDRRQPIPIQVPGEN